MEPLRGQRGRQIWVTDSFYRSGTGGRNALTNSNVNLYLFCRIFCADKNYSRFLLFILFPFRMASKKIFTRSKKDLSGKSIAMVLPLKKASMSKKKAPVEEEEVVVEEVRRAWLSELQCCLAQ